MAQKNYTTIALLAALLFTLLAPARTGSAPQAAGSSGYHLEKKVKLGGAGGWDYLEVDPATHRLFISRATHVIVVDPAQGKVIGDIPDTQGVHGIALADEFSRASPPMAALAIPQCSTSRL